MMPIQIRTILVVAFSMLAAGWTPAAHAKTPGRVHPLDPLTKPEISTVVAVLGSTGKITPDTRFAQIYLKEPEKREVLADIAAGRDELTDRYGPPPQSVLNLLAVARLRAQARRAGLTDIRWLLLAGGIIAINLREDDEVIAARLVSAEEDLLLVSKNAQAIRFHATDEAMRPMGRTA